MAEWQDVEAALEETQTVSFLRGREIKLRCPYCGDSRKDPRSTHLYLSKNWPHPWNCFRCPEASACLTTDLLDKLGASTREAAVYARKVQKEYGRAGRQRSFADGSGRRGQRMVLPKPDRSDPVDAYVLDYVERRLGGAFEDWELERYKVVTNLEGFLRSNGIEQHTLNGREDYTAREFERLNSTCVGFLSADESYLVMRSADPDWGKNPREKKYTNYQVWPKWEGSKSFVTRQATDALAERYQVVLTEGILDLVGAERSFHDRADPNLIGAACCGSTFFETLRKLIGMGIFPMTCHLYMDNDPGMLETLRKLPSRSPFFQTGLFELNVWRNDFTDPATGALEKDFGTTPERRKRVKVRI